MQPPARGFSKPGLLRGRRLLEVPTFRNMMRSRQGTRLAAPNVCYWHIADVQLALKNVCFGGRTDMTRTWTMSANDPKRTLESTPPSNPPFVAARPGSNSPPTWGIDGKVLDAGLFELVAGRVS